MAYGISNPTTTYGLVWYLSWADLPLILDPDGCSLWNGASQTFEKMALWCPCIFYVLAKKFMEYLLSTMSVLYMWSWAYHDLFRSVVGSGTGTWFLNEHNCLKFGNPYGLFTSTLYFHAHAKKIPADCPHFLCWFCSNYSLFFQPELITYSGYRLTKFE